MARIWVLPVIGVAALFLCICFYESIETLEFQEIGLNYNKLNEYVENRTYGNGRYYLGMCNRFIKFPAMVNTMYFGSEISSNYDVTGPRLRSRTHDGLTVFLEISLQYKLLFPKLYDMYQAFGADYKPILLRMAMEQLAIACTTHDAHGFFTNRSGLSAEMHMRLDKHFQAHAYSEVPFFQLRTVELPQDFESSIENTQVKEQEIEVAKALQASRKVTYQTSVIQAEQAVEAMQLQAAGASSAIYAANDAYCRQYRLKQVLQAKALVQLAQDANWKSQELLEYLKIRAVRFHASSKATVRL